MTPCFTEKGGLCRQSGDGGGESAFESLPLFGGSIVKLTKTRWRC